MAQASRVFRVFISSTFTDLKAERDALQERVFPKLRGHCAESGYLFQAIDLTRGLGDEASEGQRTMRIRLDQIACCQAVTPRPSLFLLLGAASAALGQAGGIRWCLSDMDRGRA